MKDIQLFKDVQFSHGVWNTFEWPEFQPNQGSNPWALDHKVTYPIDNMKYIMKPNMDKKYGVCIQA